MNKAIHPIDAALWLLFRAVYLGIILLGVGAVVAVVKFWWLLL